MPHPYDRYGLSAARDHGKSATRRIPAGPKIDMHGHALVPKAAEVALRYVDPSKTNFLRSSTEETQALNRQQDAERRGCLTDLSVRLKDMDKMGLDIQILLPGPSQAYYTVDPSLAPELSMLVNDGLADQAKQYPDRLVAFGTLPMQNPDAAVQELRRAVTERGIKGFQLLSNVNGTEISAPEYEDVWAAAAELAVPMLIHPLGFTQPDRLREYYFNNVIGQPLDTTVMLHHMIFSGVFERHPTLKLIAVHGGGYVGAYAARMDHAWGARPDAHAGLPKPPTHYLKQVYVDTVVFSPAQLRALVEFFGPEKVLLGTDYPYDMGEYDPVGHVVDSLDDTSAIQAICGGNAVKMLAAVGQR